MRHRVPAAPTPRYRVVAVAAALVLIGALAGVGAIVVTRAGGTSAGRPAAAPRPATSSGAPDLPSLSPLPSAPRPVSASTTSAPTHLDVPAIGVSTGLEALGIVAGGALASPSAWQVAGWFAAGVRPGDVGPAVIAGHVDSTLGPAVFYRLRDLHVGDAATVSRADGSVLTFTVDDVAEYPKSSFPTQAVYGRVSQPVLRLVTCTGDFDRSRRSYVDNLVVSLHLSATTSP